MNYKWNTCGSGVAPEPCYRKVASSTPPVCMKNDLGQDTEPQTAPDVLLPSVCECIHTFLNALNVIQDQIN